MILLRTSTGSPGAHSGAPSFPFLSTRTSPGQATHFGGAPRGYRCQAHVALLSDRELLSWVGEQGPQLFRFTVYGLFRAWSNGHPQWRVLPNRRKAVDFHFGSGQESHITLQSYYSTNKSLSPSPGLSLLGISISTSHTHTHTLCLHRAIPPIHIMAPFPYIRLLLLTKHVCRMWNPLPPDFQSTGKAHSPFVYAGMSRRQIAGLQTDGLNKSFLPSSCLPHFPKNAHCMLAPVVVPQHLLKHLSLGFRDVLACHQQAGAGVSQCCSSSPSFIATPWFLILATENLLIY